MIKMDFIKKQLKLLFLSHEPENITFIGTAFFQIVSTSQIIRTFYCPASHFSFSINIEIEAQCVLRRGTVAKCNKLEKAR